MSAYHQMGHDSRNLLSAVTGYVGAILSPVNETEHEVVATVSAVQAEGFEFVFDPQLYFPHRADRGQLGTWDYFPSDLDTADLSSADWWHSVLDRIAETSLRIGATAVCSPATVAARYSNDYYAALRARSSRLAAGVGDGVRVLETVIASLEDLATPHRAHEIASIVSDTGASGVYLVLLSDLRPRLEFANVEQIKGAMRLVALLEDAGLRVLVGFSSSDMILWKAAGATSCATGKFANLRRFTKGRFDDGEDGGRQMPYWFDEGLLAFIRTSDIVRVLGHGFAQAGQNPFAIAINEQMKADPSRPWVALGWRQYLHWFADLERRLDSGDASPRELIRDAEKGWATLERADVFMEEQRNDGSWLRAWLRAVVETD